jgi:hypothetical protein
MKASLRGLGPAAPMRAAEIAPPGGPEGRRAGARPEPPSADFETFAAPAGAYEVAFPSNWDVLSDGADAAGFSPEGGYGKLDDRLVVTHGVLAGVEDAGGADLETATRRFVEAQLRANLDFRVAGDARQVAVGGLPGLAVPIAGPSPVTGVLEVDTVYTALLPDGRMFYVITVAPGDEAQAYQPAFEQVMRSVRFP